MALAAPRLTRLSYFCSQSSQPYSRTSLIFLSRFTSQPYPTRLFITLKDLEGGYRELGRVEAEGDKKRGGEKESEKAMIYIFARLQVGYRPAGVRDRLERAVPTVLRPPPPHPPPLAALLGILSIRDRYPSRYPTARPSSTALVALAREAFHTIGHGLPPSLPPSPPLPSPLPSPRSYFHQRSNASESLLPSLTQTKAPHHQLIPSRTRARAPQVRGLHALVGNTVTAGRCGPPARPTVQPARHAPARAAAGRAGRWRVCRMLSAGLTRMRGS